MHYYIAKFFIFINDYYHALLFKLLKLMGNVFGVLYAVNSIAILI
jgi:hypothetical protein